MLTLWIDGFEKAYNLTFNKLLPFSINDQKLKDIIKAHLTL